MRKLGLLTILGVVLAMSTGVATAAGATLTTTEYGELVALQSVFADTTSLKTVAAVESLGRSCQQAGPVSGLMRAERADCDAAIKWIDANVKAVLRIKACAKQTTVAGRFGCLLPSYTGLRDTIRAVYRAEKRVNSAARTRGFRGRCVLALGDDAKSIADVARMANDMSQMVAAMRRHNVLTTQKWGGLYDADTAEMEAAGSKVPVSACPHQ